MMRADGKADPLPAPAARAARKPKPALERQILEILEDIAAQLARIANALASKGR
jgi:hypothetical protein